MDSEIYQQEQAHLSDIYQQLVQLKDELSEKLETTHKQAAQDLVTMSEEIRQDFGGADEMLETLAAIETLNSVIDTYNQVHDFDMERLARLGVLLRQPYFAKVRLRMRKGRPPRDVYIGAVGMTDEHHNPLIVDWRNPVAETYYNQEMGPTSYTVDGKVRTVELELRRQFDIQHDHLNMYFDSDIAIEDSLLLSALKSHHSPKLQAITATIQREQNHVIRHEDCPVLLVNGIAGSGKTSVLLQRIAYLLYRERKNLDARQVYLFTPNDVFRRYIDGVLPSLGESNPQTFTWREFVASQGLSDHKLGLDTTADELKTLEEALSTLQLTGADFKDIRLGDTVLLRSSSVESAVQKYAAIPFGGRFMALTTDELHSRLDRKIANLAHDEELQEAMLALDIDEQMNIFGEVLSPANEEETLAFARTYATHLYGAAHDLINKGLWLRIDRIGMRILQKSQLSSVEWLYLHLLMTGGGAKDARYVMIDEVQDYTEGQLMVLARYFSRAHFLLLGDEHQAIKQGTASFDQIKHIFEESHGEVESCELLCSYRSAPRVTKLFWSLVANKAGAEANSVQREDSEPQLIEVTSGDSSVYIDALKKAIQSAAPQGHGANLQGQGIEQQSQDANQQGQDANQQDGLCAVIATDQARIHWLEKELTDTGDIQIQRIGKDDILPATGVVLMELELAKGLEFDHVIVADAQQEVYPDTELSRNRLYTAISRAMHSATVLSQGPMTSLLTPNCKL